MSGRKAAIVLAALLMAAAATARADELVTRDGQVIETQGPWEVRGKLLVFKLEDGTLASLRLDAADLEATEQRARAAEERARRASSRPPRPAPEPPQAVLVLTDRDVAHAPDLSEARAPESGGERDPAAGAAGGLGAEDAPGGAAAGGQAADDASGAAADAEAAGSGRGVQVVQWSQESAGETGLSVRGVVQNLGSSFATSVSVNALFYDESGGLVAAREVNFENEPLGPGARRDFSVSLPHSLVYNEIKFQVVGRGFRSVGQSVRAQSPASPDGAVEEEPEIP